MGHGPTDQRPCGARRDVCAWRLGPADGLIVENGAHSPNAMIQAVHRSSITHGATQCLGRLDKGALAQFASGIATRIIQPQIMKPSWGWGPIDAGRR